MDKKILTLEMPNELHEKLETLGSEIERPKSWIVRKAVIQFFETKEVENEPT